MSKAALRELYRELPTIACAGLCQQSCGPIEMTQVEFDLICRHLGRRPPHAIVEAGRGTVLLLSPDLNCPLLSAAGRCLAYGVRPLICRLWGLVEGMRCPHGCRPHPRLLTVQEGFEFMYRSGLEGRPMSLAEARAYADRVPAAWREWVRRQILSRERVPSALECIAPDLAQPPLPRQEWAFGRPWKEGADGGRRRPTGKGRA